MVDYNYRRKASIMDVLEAETMDDKKVVEGVVEEDTSLIPVIDPSEMMVDVFSGLSTLPVTEAQAAILLAPADPNELDILPTGEVYPPQVMVRRRLVKAFGPGGWGMRPFNKPQVSGNQVVQEWALYINGRFVSYTLGGADYQATNSRLNWSDATESMKSNALVRLCKDLGMFSECWDHRWTESWKRQYVVKVWCQPKNPNDKSKPQWRRLDSAPFWNENGICADSPNQDKYKAPTGKKVDPETGEILTGKQPQKPVQTATTPKPAQATSATDNGQNKPKPEPTTPKPPTPQPVVTPTPAVTAQPSEDSPMVKELKQELLTKAREANAMVRGDLDLTPEQIQAYIDKNKATEPPMPEGVPEHPVSELEQFMGKSPTKEEPVKMVKVWDGEKWQEKNASEPIKASSGNWFAIKFIGKDKAFGHQKHLFGEPPNNQGHLGKHFGRNNFVDAKGSMNYDQFAALVGYAWYKTGDKEHGYLDPRFYADKIAEEIAKTDKVEAPQSVAVTTDSLVEKALKLGVDLETLTTAFMNAIGAKTLTDEHMERVWQVLETVEKGTVKADDFDRQLELLVVG